MPDGAIVARGADAPRGGFMGWLSGFFRAAPALPPGKLTAPTAIAGSTPLWEQFGRIGGGITPATVSDIFREADGGNPTRLCDLWSESRRKDGHIQSCFSTRETAPALLDMAFIPPEDATSQELKAVDLCTRAVNEFRNWSELVEHINACDFGHGTAEVQWENRPDGALLPRQATPIRRRSFFFTQDTGALRYRSGISDQVGIDLLEQNPGRIVQVRRRILGDALVLEGLARICTWAALFRNWDVRDWISLAELGWKPWRFGKYEPGADENTTRDAMLRVLERIGQTGAAAYPVGSEISVQWPKGQSSSQGSPHRELFEVLGREISKAVLGQTTSIEAGPNGDRAATETRDKVRGDIREIDCRVIAGALYEQLFVHVVAVNLGAGVRCPVPWFQTDESADQLTFSEAIKNLKEAGMRIPAKWVRDELGMPEPEEGEELVGDGEANSDGGVPEDDDA